MYSLNKCFMYQRHYDVEKSKSLYQYVIENIDKKDFDNIYYVVANKDHVYEVNLIGGLIIEEVKNKSSIEEIVNKLLKIYKVTFEELEKDVENFIKYLQGVGIVINE